MDTGRTGTPLSRGVSGLGRQSRTTLSMTLAPQSWSRRFLGTHALIGLAELTARYPISSAEATEWLDRWSDEGKVVRLGDSGSTADTRWAERENLAEMRRMTVAVRRRESLAVTPEIFADFLLRRHHVHPSTRGAGPAFVELILEQLQGFAAAAADWESEILARRIKDYRPAWLGTTRPRTSANWLWRAPEMERGREPQSRLLPQRDSSASSAMTRHPQNCFLSSEEAVMELLERRGASFATDLARMGGIEPSRLHLALRGELLGSADLVTNDRFDPLRPGSQATLQALTEAAATSRAGRSLRIRPRRVLAAQAEGRWARLDRPTGDPESGLVAWAGVLLERYGVLTREVVALDAFAPSWAALAPLLGRAEWRGEVRRGYFVEGLAGVQYATEEAAVELGRLGAASNTSAPLVLVSTIDPANIYGAGASPSGYRAFGGSTARLPRAAGNFLVLQGGRPILIIESYGKRLTGLSWCRRGPMSVPH